jgi:hypothetical protein
MEHKETKSNTEFSITVDIGKPDKEGRRHTSVEWTVKKFEGESIDDFEKRYNYAKTKAMRELQ